MTKTGNREILVRTATEADANTIWRLLKDLADHDGAGEKFLARPADIRREGFGPAPAFEVVLAEHGDTTAGMLKFYEIYSCYQGRRCMFVDALYVAEDFRRFGVGNALMRCAAAIARERDYGRIDLTVLPGNTRAQSFYKSLGMYRVEEELFRLDAQLFGQE